MSEREGATRRATSPKGLRYVATQVSSGVERRDPILRLSLAAVLIVSVAAANAAAQQPAETAIPDKVRLFIPYKDYSAEDNKRILDMYNWLRVADVSPARCRVPGTETVSSRIR